ncbi:MAG: tRNA (uridine(34)/cytosine(34)/5-carboxymethylaminomethyluridine(34)-2'-O)-methyltransferase TrmL [Legionellales bacterium]|nr:tRNA (uridine(34)/cytosine(34)/5-carboxymethylaminomethyluridine(34)-2'-O)-methyltransferase TrmL [Legionellales bacterium]
MLNIVLYQPQIPPNTGNIIRLCANTGATLHLIHPLGFAWDDKRLVRSGLDYHEFAAVQHYDCWSDFITAKPDATLYAFTTKAQKRYSDVAFAEGDYLIFGPETTGLPADVLQSLGTEHCLRCPMIEKSRSLNLSNTVALALYEAWRQLDFTGAK